MSFALVSVIIPTHNRPEMLAEALASVRAQTFADYEIIVVSNGESDDMRRASRGAASGCVYLEVDRGNVSWSYVKALNHYCWGAATGATLIRRRVFDEIDAFDPRLRYSEDNDLWRRISWHHSIHQMDEIMLRYRKGHQSMMHPRHDRTRHFYNLCHFIKMHLDTPREFRKELPTLRRMAQVLELRTMAQRLIILIVPAPVLDLLHRIKPRTRWLQFRQWLSGLSPAR